MEVLFSIEYGNLQIIMTSFLYLLWGLILVTSFFVVLVKHPIHSILALAIVFMEVGFLLLALNLDYLAFVFLIVYVGAIAVLFLFVTMMLNIRLTQANISVLAYLPSSIFLILTVFFQLSYLVIHSFSLLLFEFQLPEWLRPMKYEKIISDFIVQCFFLRNEEPFLYNYITHVYPHHPAIIQHVVELLLKGVSNLILELRFYTVLQDLIPQVFPRSENGRVNFHHTPLEHSIVFTDRGFDYVNVFDIFYSMSNIEAFSHCFYTYFSFSVIAGAFILLVAMIGSISLTLYHQRDIKRQSSYKQVLRSNLLAHKA